MRFVMVDEILSLEAGVRIRAVKTMPSGEELFLDHFPGFPVVPGVLLTEMMGQAAAKCLDADGTHPGRPMLGTIHSATFRDWVRPDEEILLQAEITQNRPAFARARCTAAVRGKEVAAADLFFVFAPADNFAPDYRDEVLERFLARQGS